MTTLPIAGDHPPAPDDRRLALALACAPTVGPVRFRALLARHDGRAGRALREQAPASSARAALLDEAEERLRRARVAGLALTLLGEPDYPASLYDLPDAPPALWYAGDLSHVAAPAAALVGMRAPSAYGLRCARAMAAALARAGVVVVSGMARGIDGAAHEAALDAGAPSIAVLGTGANVAYPTAHRALHARLVRDGLVLSEAPPGAVATPGAFPRRNRIIAALARVTVVVEAGVKSGALITAGVAADLGRTVAAVPGPIDVPGAAGGNALLRDGAQLVATVDDVLALAGVAARPSTAAAGRAPAVAPAGLGPDERALWDALCAPAPGADALVERTGLPVKRCITALTALELAGLVESRWSGEIARR
ncbi:DNA-processing protein DprA [Roseisolibacter agri]|uniref:DNA processing protein DprA n=1 Tax=Roseisolibacter agri TaxID=2014610 RepID=A0AA37QBW8_9BACT|nr:DNA-processing protein DprA [Roseisolibacter agri]GLC27452.1 DNA processing protein DprA [Roseisolibacter agri]